MKEKLNYNYDNFLKTENKKTVFSNFNSTNNPLSMKYGNTNNKKIENFNNKIKIFKKINITQSHQDINNSQTNLNRNVITPNSYKIKNNGYNFENKNNYIDTENNNKFVFKKKNKNPLNTEIKKINYYFTNKKFEKSNNSISNSSVKSKLTKDLLNPISLLDEDHLKNLNIKITQKLKENREFISNIKYIFDDLRNEIIEKIILNFNKFDEIIDSYNNKDNILKKESIEIKKVFLNLIKKNIINCLIEKEIDTYDYIGYLLNVEKNQILKNKSNQNNYLEIEFRKLKIEKNNLEIEYNKLRNNFQNQNKILLNNYEESYETHIKDNIKQTNIKLIENPDYVVFFLNEIIIKLKNKNLENNENIFNQIKVKKEKIELLEKELLRLKKIFN